METTIFGDLSPSTPTPSLPPTPSMGPNTTIPSDDDEILLALLLLLYLQSIELEYPWEKGEALEVNFKNRNFMDDDDTKERRRLWRLILDWRCWRGYRRLKIPGLWPALSEARVSERGDRLG
ncbi:hypothetical protein OSB04_021024 [Centaurea solstitialis]|uniref:Uncharacterized protein n=1 Tax=Centaurea solstitialis TaxID=347529 RepID=A0AA38WHE8_9ASTR|nr:hypothetical protein OSB04_021024 [Centaurea solstitialis]